MSRDQRRHPRINIQIEVELIAPEIGAVTLQSGNLSDSGLYLCADQSMPLQIGSEVCVRLKQALGDGEAPLVKARVVRIEEQGIGLHFHEDAE
ncbi:PilZ domain-containing protein [Sulfurivermis fontis]|uniref:PilZ domain-containing protein n=1 Tax=Sulfurivermis fontis TaxID=1972068 RepID=UPI000FDBC7EF|nr:PilZ domain-containing protein [Sulfurivermis fontis]